MRNIAPSLSVAPAAALLTCVAAAVTATATPLPAMEPAAMEPAATAVLATTSRDAGPDVRGAAYGTAASRAPRLAAPETSAASAASTARPPARLVRAKGVSPKPVPPPGRSTRTTTGKATSPTTVTSATKPSGTTPGRTGTSPMTVRVGADSFFRTSVAKAPLDPNSATLAAQLHHQVTSRRVAMFNAYHHNASLYTVTPTTARTNVTFWDCQNKGYLPTGLYDGKAHFKNVPIPPGALPAEGTDRALSIYSPDTDQLWEFWQARKNTTTGTWEACWGGRIDNLSTSNGVFERPYGATATGIAMAAGMISLQDVRQGSINHAMYLAIPQSRAFPEISWPAVRSDGRITNGSTVRQGQRLRLDPTLDLTKYNLTPIGAMIAKAAQTYGFVVADTAGVVAVASESGLPEKQRTGTNPWDTLLTVPDYRILDNFPWDKIQVIQSDYGKP